MLQELSARIKSCLRDYDILGRYGGEEFLAVLPHTTVEDAAVVAERIRATVHGTPVLNGNVSVLVSVSIGIAVTVSLDEDVAETIQRADAGLYKAKHNGRNQVCIASVNDPGRQAASN